MATAREAYGDFLRDFRAHLIDACGHCGPMKEAIAAAKTVMSDGIPHMLEFPHPDGRLFRIGFRQNLLTDDRLSKVFALELPGMATDKSTPDLPPWTRGRATRDAEEFPFLQVEWANAKPPNKDYLDRLYHPQMRQWLMDLGVDFFRFGWGN